MKALGILITLAGAFVLVSAFLLFFPYDWVLGSFYAAMSLVMIWAGLLMTRVRWLFQQPADWQSADRRLNCTPPKGWFVFCPISSPGSFRSPNKTWTRRAQTPETLHSRPQIDWCRPQMQSAALSWPNWNPPDLKMEKGEGEGGWVISELKIYSYRFFSKPI